MANNKTILKAIERKGKRIAKQKQKLRWSKSIKDRDKAREEIARLSSEELRLRQQIRFNQAVNDVQRDKETSGTKRVQALDEDRQRCDQVGAGEDNPDGDDSPW